MKEISHEDSFPALPLQAWESSKITLHLWMQIVGKVKLDLMPRRNHWWHITFHVNARGLTSGPIPHEKGIFELQFNFDRHVFEIITSWQEVESFPLNDGLTVAQFYKEFFDRLESLGIHSEIVPVPYDHPCKEPFEVCRSYHRYDKKFISRFWRILISVNTVFNKFSGRFYGKVSPAHIYWHHMDLAVTRFSGKPGPELPENASIADKEAYSHEVISAGFWAGDENVRGAAFYSYTYPSPDGIENELLLPESAKWVDSNGSPMALLMYDDLIRSSDPENDLMDFLETSYQAGARLAGWPKELTLR